MIDIEGDLLFNKKLFIGYFLKNSFRNNNDFFVFFGTVAYFNNKIINDFVLNIKGDNIIDGNKIFSNIIFIIFYDKILGKFYFKNIIKFKRENINFNLDVLHIQKNEIHIQNNMIIQFLVLLIIIFYSIKR